MPDATLASAAQYLRMSTEDQQYSIANQRSRIQEYADQNGFEIVGTYEDPGKTGVIIKKRKGLSALLKEVVSSPWWKYLVCSNASGLFAFVIGQRILSAVSPIGFAGAQSDFPDA
jgi:DNA invertase Pin-like site-specific DNA recombinase